MGASSPVLLGFAPQDRRYKRAGTQDERPAQNRAERIRPREITLAGAAPNSRRRFPATFKKVGL
jgi:hypothetical protein